uniref:Uncharacterized protein n=2 Tax=Meloidogyne TaxID=189290 RepID=A0A6V7W8N4_MELEN|nr:unnamed protein product [Meloidogyne enterolobii]
MYSIGGKIIITSVLLVIIFEFDVVSCGRLGRRQRIQASAYSGFETQHQYLQDQLNNLRHEYHINELRQLAQQALNLRNHYVHNPEIQQNNQVNINLYVRKNLLHFIPITFNLTT